MRSRLFASVQLQRVYFTPGETCQLIHSFSVRVRPHGGSGVAHGVIESLRSMRPAAKFLELVHRLDRETSGVLLVAKKRSALTALHEAMRDRSIDKRYLVGTAGRFRNEMQRVR